MKSSLITCIRCNKEFPRLDCEIRKTKNGRFFCSKSCSASCSNLSSPKRKPEGQCKMCNKSLTKSRTYCNPCLVVFRKSKEAKPKVVKAKIPKIQKCSDCGYDKYIEISHIKPISSYPDDTPLSVINDASNLSPLCRNCHWEFDH